MPVHQGFVDAIVAEPLEQVHFMAYSDWLDEHNDPFADVLRKTPAQMVSDGIRVAESPKPSGTDVYVVDGAVHCDVMELWTRFVEHVSRQEVTWYVYRSYITNVTSGILRCTDGCVDDVVDAVRRMLSCLVAWHNHSVGDCNEKHRTRETVGQFEYGWWFGSVTLEAKKLSVLLNVPDELLMSPTDDAMQRDRDLDEGR